MRSSVSTISQMVPDETLVYAEARNLTELQAAWKKTPFHALWNSNELAPFLEGPHSALAEAQREFEKDTGLAVAECQRMFPGDAAVFLADTMRIMRPWSEEPVTDWNGGTSGENAPFTLEDIHCLGVAEGDLHILHWHDPDD